MPQNQIILPYEVARPHILDGDVLLYHGRGLRGWSIGVAGRDKYSHAGMAGWTNGNPGNTNNRLMVYEMLWFGGQGSHLRASAEKWPQRIDVYRVSDTHTSYRCSPNADMCSGEELQHSLIPIGTTSVLDRKQAVTLMRDFCRPGEYGKIHLLMTAMSHMPFVRFFYRPPTDDQLEDRSRPPFCSEAISYALRKAFSDVVKRMPDHFTSPGDLAHSPLLHYMFTLDAPTYREVTE